MFGESSGEGDLAALWRWSTHTRRAVLPSLAASFTNHLLRKSSPGQQSPEVPIS